MRDNLISALIFAVKQVNQKGNGKQLDDKKNQYDINII